MKKTRYVILGLLQEEPLSGYDIKKIIDIRMSFFWQESYGQIYPELGKMKNEGLIELVSPEEEMKRLHNYDDLPENLTISEVVTGSSNTSKPEKIRYCITPAGQRALKSWMQSDNEKDTTRSEFLLKMYFATENNQEEMKKHLLEFAEQADKKVMLFTMFEKELKGILEEHSNHRQLLKVLELGLRQAKLYSEWSREMLKDLE